MILMKVWYSFYIVNYIIICYIYLVWGDIYCVVFMQEFDSFESDKVDDRPQKTQLEIYLDEPRIDRNVELDILSFWKKNQLRFPKLASMVCDVSSIPISTITSEFAFSAGEQVIDQFSSALKPDVVEALVCTKDWLYGDKGNIIYFYIHLLFSIHKTLLNF